jgi:hypothetical protein
VPQHLKGFLSSEGDSCNGCGQAVSVRVRWAHTQAEQASSTLELISILAKWGPVLALPPRARRNERRCRSDSKEWLVSATAHPSSGSSCSHFCLFLGHSGSLGKIPVGCREAPLIYLIPLPTQV